MSICQLPVLAFGLMMNSQTTYYWMSIKIKNFKRITIYSTIYSKKNLQKNYFYRWVSFQMISFASS